MTHTEPVQIEINVMRSRLTIIGFNIAIVSFQIATLLKMSGGVSIPGVDHPVHFRADMALFISLGFSLISMMAFIISGELKNKGACDHWTFILGDFLMYLGLANTVTGFFSPLNETFMMVTSLQHQTNEQLVLFQNAILILGAMAWVTATYIGPWVSLCRSPFSRKININLAILYICILLSIFWFSSQAYSFEESNTEQHKEQAISLLYEFFQPLTW